MNYSPDRAVRFDLEGNSVRVYDQAYSPGEITANLGRRPLSPGEIELLLGGALTARACQDIRAGAKGSKS